MKIFFVQPTMKKTESAFCLWWRKLTMHYITWVPTSSHLTLNSCRRPARHFLP